jgi:ABC-2 type transport system ATP-binding protein
MLGGKPGRRSSGRRPRTSRKAVRVLEFQLLGLVEAWTDGRRVALGPRQQRLFFAILALDLNQVVPVDRLTELIWSQSPPRTARHALHVIVSRLRNVFAEVRASAELEGTGAGYVLRADARDFDVYRFRDLLRQARATADPRRRIELLDDALALWSGPALHGTAPARSLESLCRGLEEARLSAVEDRVAAGLELGRHRELLAELPRLVDENPLRERMLSLFMVALHRSGRSPEALDAYRQARVRFDADLGMAPGVDVQAIELAILRGDPALERWAPPKVA